MTQKELEEKMLEAIFVTLGGHFDNIIAARRCANIANEYASYLVVPKFPQNGTDEEKDAWIDKYLKIVPLTPQDIERAKESFEKHKIRSLNK